MAPQYNAVAPGTTDKITFLLNWHATPYHAPLFLAQSKGYFAEEGIKVAILEPNDPSDVTELIGSGAIDMGAKVTSNHHRSKVHTIAGKARGFPVKSIGTLKPFTGVVYLEGSGITTDFTSLRGKRIGYVGEFGKVQIDELTKHYGMTPEEYTAVRVGMNVSGAIIAGDIDAGIGLENVQCVELEAYCESVGRPKTDVKMLRIDELAELGCCCFCSILLIANESFLAREPLKAAAFMRAVHKASVFLKSNPVQAWDEYKACKKTMRTEINAKIFERSFAYMSVDNYNVARDWDKVTNYCKRLGILAGDFTPNYTNEFIGWPQEPELVSPTENQILIAAEQEKVKNGGGCLCRKEIPSAPAFKVSA
ncbi:NMT1/THI5 like-domain-containing protein [Leucosporidium creatinivorum]|uniref:4-amino-5-hydroxymethyl-2-methylpyrimidine phosphate synthase n=1 Tax=Leucosporidium creatinivorum TaxID=106004 RepID=A0A1Y2BZ71_9BASI|nr:NMT1/THI5 like-domain-containing protein [Leucosporidium creatinivorum]